MGVGTREDPAEAGRRRGGKQPARPGDRDAGAGGGLSRCYQGKEEG